MLDKLDGTLVADAGSARDVIDCIAAKGHDVDDAFGWDAEDGFHAPGVEDQVVFHGVEDRDALVYELHHVFVGGDDEDFVAQGGEFAGERADDVVGFKAFIKEDGDAEGFEGAADVGLLLDEIGRSLGAVGFVATVFDGLEGLGFDVELFDVLHLRGHFVSMDGSTNVVDGGEILRLEVLAQLVDHVDEDVGGGGRDAGARGHGALALHRVISAEDEGHGVEQVDWGLFVCVRRGCHRSLMLPVADGLAAGWAGTWNACRFVLTPQSQIPSLRSR